MQKKCFVSALGHAVVNYFRSDWKRLFHDDPTEDLNDLETKWVGGGGVPANSS